MAELMDRGMEGTGYMTPMLGATVSPDGMPIVPNHVEAGFQKANRDVDPGAPMVAEVAQVASIMAEVVLDFVTPIDMPSSHLSRVVSANGTPIHEPTRKPGIYAYWN